MLQIDTYRGSTSELVKFVNSVWSHSYLGQMTFPHWTEAFFDWQFRLDATGDRRNLIAAYVDDKLAGVLLGTEYPMRFPSGCGKGSQWSWLSIHSDYRGQGIAKALDRERVLRLQADESKLIVSFRYIGSKSSQAERPDSRTPDPKFNRKIGFWARVIDANRFAQWHWSGVEGFLAKAASPFCRIPKRRDGRALIREFQADDLDSCLNIVQSSYRSCQLSIDWDRQSLRHQLNGSTVCKTVVLEQGGQIGGFVNFHILNFQAKTVEKVAIIDLIAVDKLSSSQATQLLNASLAEMEAQGVILALKLRCGDAPAWPLLRSHFIPEKSDSLLVLQPISGMLNVTKSDSLHILWR